MSTRRRRSRWRLLQLVGSMAVLVVAATTAMAAATGRAPSASPSPAVFGIGPSAADRLDGRPYYFYLSGPGGSLSDHVAVVNVGTTPLALTVYATDAGNSADGSFAFPAAAVKPKDVGTWIHVAIPGGGRTVTVHGRSKVFLPITMTVPGNAVPGDHAGALIASLQGEVRNSQGQLIHLDQRVATRVFVRISGPLHPRLAIESLSATYHGSANPFAPGDVTVSYVVHNTGNVKLGGDQSVAVSGLFGATEATSPAQVPLLLPGGSVHETVEVHGVWPQLWMTGDVTVTALGLHADVDPAAGPWTATTHFWAVPWALLVLVLLIVVLTLAWRRLRRVGAGAGADPGGPTPHDEEPSIAPVKEPAA